MNLLTLCLLGHFLCFFVINFFKKSFSNTIRVSNSFDPDQPRGFVEPDLGPNCLQKLSVEHTTVTSVLSNHSKIGKTKVLKTNGSLMKVESIAECSFGAFINTFDLH